MRVRVGASGVLVETENAFSDGDFGIGQQARNQKARRAVVSIQTRTMQVSGKWFQPARATVVLLLVGCALLASGALALAADGGLRWRWSNPRPHGGNVVAQRVRQEAK